VDAGEPLQPIVVEHSARVSVAASAAVAAGCPGHIGEPWFEDVVGHGNVRRILCAGSRHDTVEPTSMFGNSATLLALL
jgi:hypothetical protein